MTMIKILYRFCGNVIKLRSMSFRASALRRAKSRLRRLRFARRCGARLAWESPHKKEIATTRLRTGFAMTPNLMTLRFCGAEFFVKNFPCDPGLKRIFAYPLDTKEK